jgi:hypothetical protein
VDLPIMLVEGYGDTRSGLIVRIDSLKGCRGA